MGSRYLKLGDGSFIPRGKIVPTVTITPGFTGLKLRFQGNNFGYYVRGLYLSANTNNAMLSCFDFYSHIKSISSKFHAFSGYPIEDYTVIDNNTLSIQFPKINLSAVNIDFIFTNPAGYVKASQSSRFTHIKILSS